MDQGLKDREIQILHMVQNSSTPIGAWAIVGLLEDEGASASPATVGRILNRLERQGYLRKSSFKGRMITPAGVAKIKHTQKMKLLDKYNQELDSLSTSTKLQHFLMVLEARKTVERDIIRLAARNMTDEVIQELDQIEATREQYYLRSMRSSKSDVDFHYTVAVASRNEVFIIFSQILCALTQRTELFDFMGEKNGKPFYTGHKGILEALKERDPDKAEAAMTEHIDTLIGAVKKWWDEYHRPANTDSE